MSTYSTYSTYSYFGVCFLSLVRGYTLSHFGYAYAAAVPARPVGSTRAMSSATPRKHATPEQDMNVLMVEAKEEVSSSTA